MLLAAPRGGTRRGIEEGRELLLPRSISSFAAAAAPSQQQQATAVSRDHERSTGALLLICSSIHSKGCSLHHERLYSRWKDSDGNIWVSLTLRGK